jgi:hypothetical protein
MNALALLLPHVSGQLAFVSDLVALVSATMGAMRICRKAIRLVRYRKRRAAVAEATMATGVKGPS